MLLQTYRALEAAALNDLEKESTILMLSTELVARDASPSSLLHCSGESDWIESVNMSRWSRIPAIGLEIVLRG